MACMFSWVSVLLFLSSLTFRFLSGPFVHCKIWVKIRNMSHHLQILWRKVYSLVLVLKPWNNHVFQMDLKEEAVDNYKRLVPLTLKSIDSWALPCTWTMKQFIVAVSISPSSTSWCHFTSSICSGPNWPISRVLLTLLLFHWLGCLSPSDPIIEGGRER